MDKSSLDSDIFEQFSDTFLSHGFDIVLIICLVYISRKFSQMIITRIVRKALSSHRYKTARDERLREETLVSTITAGVHVFIWIMGGMLILSELGINIAPLIAGAGIAGVALGFGAQSMVKDFLAGIFIVFENQYRVGDVVEFNQTISGTVSRITLRTTVLRDLDGNVHHIPNGMIGIATNKTMDYANVNLDITVSYDTDIDALEKLINKVGNELAEDEKWRKKIKDAPQFVRVSNFAESAIVVKILGKTEPVQQWSVAGELRRRLKKAFDEAGIEMPYPQRVIHQVKDAPKKKTTR